MLSHARAGCWGFIGGHGLWWREGGHMKKALVGLVRGRRVSPGHEEAFLDAVLGGWLALLGCVHVVGLFWAPRGALAVPL
jgi:hypothetical protein